MNEEMHCMVDIESLDITPTTIILSIGAVLFTQNDVRSEHTFYRELDVDIQKDLERTSSPSTIQFWKEQEAKGMRCPNNGMEPLGVVLEDFSTFYKHFKCKTIWANGITFDISALENAYRYVGIPIPWKYNQMRDARTLYRLFPESKTILEQNTHYHNALADATFQAQALIWIFKCRLNVTNGVLA
jgi:hypothetical protein